ncbi:MAG: cold shock domain-containing protein [Rhodospirillaceae bacterium]
MMRKDKGFRGPRKRGFDDDVPYVPETRGTRPTPRPASGFTRESSAADGPTVDATVKWFNSEKGFGFAELSDGTGDAFLHIGALQASGHETVAPGAKLRVQVGQGAKGPQITRVLEVDETSATQQAPRSPARSGSGGGGSSGGGGGGSGFGSPRPARGAPDVSSAIAMAGTVKWFNGEKGFGFVASEDGGKDVFVHVSVLGTAGLTTLPEGQRVSMQVVDTQKGREAVSITLAN